MGPPSTKMAPKAGLEPATCSLHFARTFHCGVDYIMIQLPLDPGGFHASMRVLPFGIVSEPSDQYYLAGSAADYRDLFRGFRLPAIHPVFRPNLHSEAAIRHSEPLYQLSYLGINFEIKICITILPHSPKTSGKDPNKNS